MSTQGPAHAVFGDPRRTRQLARLVRGRPLRLRPNGESPLQVIRHRVVRRSRDDALVDFLACPGAVHALAGPWPLCRPATVGAPAIASSAAGPTRVEAANVRPVTSSAAPPE